MFYRKLIQHTGTTHKVNLAVTEFSKAAGIVPPDDPKDEKEKQDKRAVVSFQDVFRTMLRKSERSSSWKNPQYTRMETDPRTLSWNLR